MISRPRLYLSYQPTGTTQPIADRLGERLTDTFDVLVDLEWPADSDSPPVELLDDVEAVVVIVGPQWRALLEEDRRLVRPRNEAALLVVALDRSVPIVIVLVEGASLPEADQLPEGLRPLVECESVVLADGTFAADVAGSLACSAGWSSRRGRHPRPP